MLRRGIVVHATPQDGLQQANGVHQSNRFIRDAQQSSRYLVSNSNINNNHHRSLGIQAPIPSSNGLISSQAQQHQQPQGGMIMQQAAQYPQATRYHEGQGLVFSGYVAPGRAFQQQQQQQQQQFSSGLALREFQHGRKSFETSWGTANATQTASKRSSFEEQWGGENRPNQRSYAESMPSQSYRGRLYPQQDCQASIDHPHEYSNYRDSLDDFATHTYSEPLFYNDLQPLGAGMEEYHDMQQAAQPLGLNFPRRSTAQHSLPQWEPHDGTLNRQRKPAYAGQVDDANGGHYGPDASDIYQKEMDLTGGHWSGATNEVSSAPNSTRDGMDWQSHSRQASESDAFIYNHGESQLVVPPSGFGQSMPMDIDNTHSDWNHDMFGPSFETMHLQQQQRQTDPMEESRQEIQQSKSVVMNPYATAKGKQSQQEATRQHGSKAGPPSSTSQVIFGAFDAQQQNLLPSVPYQDIEMQGLSFPRKHSLEHSHEQDMQPSKLVIVDHQESTTLQPGSGLVQFQTYKGPTQPTAAPQVTHAGIATNQSSQSPDAHCLISAKTTESAHTALSIPTTAPSSLPDLPTSQNTFDNKSPANSIDILQTTADNSDELSDPPSFPMDHNPTFESPNWLKWFQGSIQVDIKQQPITNNSSKLPADSSSSEEEEEEEEGSNGDDTSSSSSSSSNSSKSGDSQSVAPTSIKTSSTTPPNHNSSVSTNNNIVQSSTTTAVATITLKATDSPDDASLSGLDLIGRTSLWGDTK